MMLILDGKTPGLSLVGRLVEVHYLLAANPDHQVAFIEDATLAKMKSGETLFLLGHGDPGTLGDAWKLTPTELAVTLLNKGLKDNTYVVLGSCSGGVTDLVRGTSYFEELVAAVWNEGALRIGGEAYTGVTAITAQGTYLTKDPLLNNLLQQQGYRQILTNNQFELAQAVQLLTVLSKKKNSTIELMANAITEATDTTFQALFNHNHGVRKLAGDVQRVQLRMV